MNKKESNIQTAFILSIIAHSIMLLFVIVPGYISIPGDTITRLIVTFSYFPAPMVLGIISANMNKVSSLEGVGTKFKVYRIFVYFESGIDFYC
jgi:hypothetical protein